MSPDFLRRTREESLWNLPGSDNNEVLTTGCSARHERQTVQINATFTVHVTKIECIYKLEIWGRAQLEATRRRKSDWKDNLGS